MFYKSDESVKRAALVFTPDESKRLIAAGIAQLTEVKNALRQGIVVIAGGSTNGFVASEILKTEMNAYRYTVGRIYRGELGTTPEEERSKPIILTDGERSDMTIDDALAKFSVNDVFIKGANAVDPAGNAGVLAANPQGGTVGAFWGLVTARGANLICPVGLEKLISSVDAACNEAGQGRFTYHMGLAVALMPIAGAKVFTEIQAIKQLFDLEATHIASGGIMGSEGSVVLSVKGNSGKIEAMWNDIMRFKNRK